MENKKHLPIFACALTAVVTALLLLGIFVLAEGYVLPPLQRLTRQLTGLTGEQPRIEAEVQTSEENEGEKSPQEEQELAVAEQKLNQIIHLLQDNYFEELSEIQIYESLCKGLLENVGSPYTFYLNPEQNAAEDEMRTGSYYGIGATLSQKDKNFLISDLADRSPASQSGLKIGDILLQVNEREIAEFPDVAAVAQEVRGEEGTEVHLKVYRSSDSQEYEFAIKRAKISNHSLHQEMLDNKIAYLRITEFNGGLAENFINNVQTMQEQGARAFVIDLRNNGGGFVNEDLAMLDFILPEGEIAHTEGRTSGKPEKEYWNSEASFGLKADLPIVILMNENSASASELFAGCLRDHGRAKLVGKKSFGKGVGTNTYQLIDGSAAQITNFRYYLPKGDCIDGKGLEPDFEVDLPEGERGKSVSQIERSQDSQLQKALELIEKELRGEE